MFAHLPDLGCGQEWGAVWKVRPPAPLACDECGHRMHAKISRHGLRFFAHAPGAPSCAVALESMEHHLLKLELANAARDAGAYAEMEVRGPDGKWRADVLASGPGGTWQWALEAQLAPVTASDIEARTIWMAADGVWSIWFSDKPKPPWLGIVPSVRLAHPEDGGGLVVAEGLVKWSGYQWQAVPASLTEFLGWAFTGRIVNEAPHAAGRGGRWFWTAPRYLRAWNEYRAEKERVAERNRRVAERNREREREKIRRANAISRAKAHSEVAAAEQAARGPGLGSTDAQRREWRERTARRRDVTEIVARRGIALLAQRGVTATVGWSIGDPRYADGIPLVDADGALAAVFDPAPRWVQGRALLLLAGTLLLFPTAQSQRLFEERVKHKPLDGWQTDHC